MKDKELRKRLQEQNIIETHNNKMYARSKVDYNLFVSFVEACMNAGIIETFNMNPIFGTFSYNPVDKKIDLLAEALGFEFYKKELRPDNSGLSIRKIKKLGKTRKQK